MSNRTTRPSECTLAAIGIFNELDAEGTLHERLRAFYSLMQRENIPPALVHLAAGAVCKSQEGLEIATRLMRLGSRLNPANADRTDADGLAEFLELGL